MNWITYTIKYVIVKNITNGYDIERKIAYNKLRKKKPQLMAPCIKMMKNIPILHTVYLYNEINNNLLTYAQRTIL